VNEGSTESLAAAWEYVQAHGDLLDRARFAALAGRPVEGAPIPAAVPQNPDGGWPAFWSAGLSTLDGTCYQLFLLRGMPAASLAVDLPAALAFLARAQAADGTWSEGPSPTTPQFEIPHWLLPGSPGARAYLTANCAATLADYEAEPAAVAKASEVLEWLVDPHGRLPAPLVAHWLAARVLRTQARIMVVRRLLDVVGRSFETFNADDLAWFGSCTRPGDRWNRRIAAKLLGQQNPDGSWTDPLREQPSPTLTVSAASVLLAAEQSGPVRYPAMYDAGDSGDED
jgi:hypothetical protein